MLPRSHRLSTEQLASVMEKGRAVHSPFFLARISKAAGKSRIAAVAPKKIAKTAVERNKMRRRIYEAVQPLYSSMPEGFHVALFVKAPAMTASLDALNDEIKKTFVKAGLISEVDPR